MFRVKRHLETNRKDGVRMLKSNLVRSIPLLASVYGLSACAYFAPAHTQASDAVVVEASAQKWERESVTPVQAEDSYYVKAKAAIDKKIEARQSKQAKNVILFVGDGMGVSTITAARIYAGQQKGVDGESYQLAMDTLPWSALSKTYSHDFQIADSSATATAMTAGVKVPSGTVGLLQDVARGNCATEEGNETDSLFAIAEEAGLATGVISTARLTHATPASTYAQSADRNWEDDTEVGADCRDIARQFIEWPHGDGFEVALGGGRRHFMPATMADPEYEDKTGRRADGRDLTKEWVAKSYTHAFIYDKAGFEAIDFNSDARVLGLFEPSHMQYALDNAEDGAGEPTLADLTAAAITRLSREENGYILMVEGGRVDHAHHAGNAARALGDAVALDDAVAKALEMTSDKETLILVTADHSHTLTIAGYAKRNNPILGLSASDFALIPGADGKPYTTLGYANGPGSACAPQETDENGEVTGSDCERSDLSDVDTTEKNFQQQSLVPLGSETHAGEDVALLASGPGANLVSGVMEQNEIFHVMARSLGLVE